MLSSPADDPSTLPPSSAAFRFAFSFFLSHAAHTHCPQQLGQLHPGPLVGMMPGTPVSPSCLYQRDMHATQYFLRQLRLPVAVSCLVAQKYRWGGSLLVLHWWQLLPLFRRMEAADMDDWYGMGMGNDEEAEDDEDGDTGMTEAVVMASEGGRLTNLDRKDAAVESNV